MRAVDHLANLSGISVGKPTFCAAESAAGDRVSEVACGAVSEAARGLDNLNSLEGALKNACSFSDNANSITNDPSRTGKVSGLGMVGAAASAVLLSGAMPAAAPALAVVGAIGAVADAGKFIKDALSGDGAVHAGTTHAAIDGGTSDLAGAMWERGLYCSAADDSVWCVSGEKYDRTALTAPPVAAQPTRPGVSNIDVHAQSVVAQLGREEVLDEVQGSISHHRKAYEGEFYAGLNLGKRNGVFSDSDANSMGGLIAQNDPVFKNPDYKPDYKMVGNGAPIPSLG